MDTIYENESTPKKDGYRMPGEFEPQECIWMLWPHRPDNWRDGAKPAQKAFADVARGIAQFEPVIVGVNPEDYAAAHYVLAGEENILVVEMTSDDSWIRDCGPTFVVNDDGDVRAVHWHFNAWGGLLEGGSIHVDGEGTVMTTEMCLLSEGRNPELSKEQIENYLCEYLGVDKVIWIKDGIDPEETNGHIDDVACFVRPGEVACIWTDDEDNPFYEAAHAAYETLSNATDAKGRQLKVHKLTMPKEPTYMTQEEVDAIDVVEGTIPRTTDDVCIASYMNFLIGNDFVLVPQYDDEYDEKALQQVQQMFPEREVVGVPTREVVYGGGNIHCITQQQPAGV